MSDFSILPGFWRKNSPKIKGALDLKKAVKLILKQLGVSYKDACCGDSFTGDAPEAAVPEATTTDAGLMSAADKTKLDGVATQANKYTLPAATATVIGGVKKAATVANAAAGTEVDTINAIIAAMKAAGQMA